MIMKIMKKFLFAALMLVYLAGSARAGEDAARLNDEVFILNEVFIISGEMLKVMKETPAASGEKYEALGDPETVFWSKGGEAFLTIEGKDCPRYVLVRPFAGGTSGELFLTVDGRNYIMKMAVSASGSKYEAVDDPETILWNKEDWVSLTVAGRDYPGYDVWQPLGRIWLRETPESETPKP